MQPEKFFFSPSPPKGQAVSLCRQGQIRIKNDLGIREGPDLSGPVEPFQIRYNPSKPNLSNRGRPRDLTLLCHVSRWWAWTTVFLCTNPIACIYIRLHVHVHLRLHLRGQHVLYTTEICCMARTLQGVTWTLRLRGDDGFALSSTRSGCTPPSMTASLPTVHRRGCLTTGDAIAWMTSTDAQCTGGRTATCLVSSRKQLSNILIKSSCSAFLCERSDGPDWPLMSVRVTEFRWQSACTSCQ